MALLGESPEVMKSGRAAGAPFVIPHPVCHGDSVCRNSAHAIAPAVCPVGSSGIRAVQAHKNKLNR